MMYLYTEKKNRIDVSEKSALLYLNSNGNVFFVLFIQFSKL